MPSKDTLQRRIDGLRKREKANLAKINELQAERNAALAAQREAQGQVARYERRDRLKAELDDLKAAIEKCRPKSFVEQAMDLYYSPPKLNLSRYVK